MTGAAPPLGREIEARFDAALAGLPCFSGRVEELVLSPLLPDSSPLARSYAASFPQHAFAVGNALAPERRYLLSPTCCYPVFHHLTGRTVPEGLYTAKALCFRCEAQYTPGVRQSAYLMREYIRFTTDLDALRGWIEDVKTQAARLLSDLRLAVRVEKATDPFFDPASLKQRFQDKEALKSELVVDGLAVASVNLHLRAFTKSCAIASETGAPLYSACFGLGYDRLAHLLDRERPPMPAAT